MLTDLLAARSQMAISLGFHIIFACVGMTMPFSLEGTAFFVEAIALGLFLYGWNRLTPQLHWVCGLIVGVSGVMSVIFVVAANAFMNSPAEFEIVNGKVTNIDPVDFSLK